MHLEIISLRDKKIEQSLVRISAKVADAVEITQQAKPLSADSKNQLIQASLELEELYLVMGEHGQTDKK